MTVHIPKEMIAEGYIRVQHHPTRDLHIYNYSEKTAFERCWNEYTKMCRGLVLDGKGNVVARPFGKFFNLEEHVGDLPTESPVVREKYDGSLGIIFVHEGELYCCTRGSFESVQAKACKALLTKYPGALAQFYKWPEYTHLVEVICPESRVVVKYDEDKLVYLGTRHTKTGSTDLCFFEDSVEFDMPEAESLPFKLGQDPKSLYTQSDKNREGFVLYYPRADLFLKLKFEEYKRLHKLITGMNVRTIWEYLSEGRPVTDILKQVPDEFYAWVKDEAWKLNVAKGSVMGNAKLAFDRIIKDLDKFDGTREHRKLFALKAVQHKNPQLLFQLYDKNDITKSCWDLVRPTNPHYFNGSSTNPDA